MMMTGISGTFVLNSARLDDAENGRRGIYQNDRPQPVRRYTGHHHVRSEGGDQRQRRAPGTLLPRKTCRTRGSARCGTPIRAEGTKRGGVTKVNVTPQTSVY